MVKTKPIKKLSIKVKCYKKEVTILVSDHFKPMKGERRAHCYGLLWMTILVLKAQVVPVSDSNHTSKGRRDLQ